VGISELRRDFGVRIKVPEETFADRLKELIGDRPANRFAREVNIGESLLRKYLAGAIPGIDKVAQISEATGASVDWLVTGNRIGGTAVAVEAKSMRDLEAGLTFVPRLEVSASAGHGALWEHEQAVELVAFQSAWLRGLGINPIFARMLTARGDSMESTIRDGDLLLVDTSINEVRDNGIYCVVFGSLLLVKRINVRRNGSAQLISDNPVYPPEDVTPGEVQQLSIAGRVMWFGRSI
jgi:phage repressor protein C with HTH and peptisase S24 domain